MKRIFCFLFAVCMIISATAVTYASDDILGELGIMNVRNDKHVVSKGEFAEAIAAILNINTDITDGSAEFTDISAEDSYYGAVIKLAELGILNGDGEGKINADKALTFNQAVKMVLCMLGYEPYASVKGGYPNGYLHIAREVDLLSGIKMRGEGWLEEQEAADLLMNALETPVLNVSSMDTNGNMDYETADLPMYVYHKLNMGTGVVTGLYGIESTNRSELDENQIRIDEKVYTYEKTGKVQIGQKVKFFYDENDSVRALAPAKGSEVEEIDLEDVISVKDNCIEYFDSEKNKRQSVSYSPSCDIIYNFGLIESLVWEDVKDFTGTLRTVSNDYGRTVDCIVVDAYIEMVVGAVDTTAKLLYDKHKSTVPGYAPLSLDEDKKTVSITDDYATSYSIEDIIVGQMIAVRESRDGKYVTVNFCDNEVTGKIEQIGNDSLTPELIINGISYKATSYYVRNCDVQLGATGKFLLSRSGRIAYFVPQDTEIIMGYIVAGAEEILPKEYVLKIMTEDNAFSVYNLAKKVKLYDGNAKTAESLYNSLTKDDKIVPQLIRYKVNADNEINYMETAQPFNTQAQTLQTMIDLSDATYRKTSMTIGSKVVVGEKTKMFLLPKGLDSDEMKYTITRATTVLEDSGKYTVSAYRFDNVTHTADVLVQMIDYDSPASVDTIMNFAVYDRHKYLIDKDGEETIAMTVIADGVRQEVQLDNTSIFSSLKDKDGKSHKLIRGDIISYKFHPTTGKIIAMKLEYDSYDEVIVGSESSGSASSSTHYTYNAYAYEISGSNMWVSSADVTKELTLSSLTPYDIKGVVSYDSENDELVLAPISAIRDYVHTGISDRVFIHQKKYKPVMIYILR